jgi:hypothetical protein
MPNKHNMCPREVPPEIWDEVLADTTDPTIHMPDVAEEGEIAASLFRLRNLGVEPPILLSQIGKPELNL